jgi:penicillin-binding protein 2
VALWFQNETRLPQGRLSAMSYGIAGLTLLLLVGFWKLQVIDTEKYAEMAERNRIRSLPILAPRGRILDREGRELVTSYPSFRIVLLRDNPAEVESSLPLVAEGLGISVESIRAKIEEKRGLARFYPIEIKPEATPADIAFIESHRVDVPVLELQMVHRRKYPADGFLSHAIGYVGEVSEQQVEKSNGLYQAGDIVGKSGLERQYNGILMGKDGLRRVVVNSVGKEVAKLKHEEATPGNPIQLTLDLDLQIIAEEAMRGQKGAVVALDPRSGEVLVLVSQPAPDPNKFAVSIPAEEWKRLLDDPDKPMLNRAVQAQLAPGSVFKIVMGAAMLETKSVPEDFQTYCSGAADFYGREFKCHIFRKGGHGVADLHKAIVQSCDIFFYNLGKRMGIERIATWARSLGLGRKTGIDLPSEESGLVPSEEWKLRARKEKWYAGETISVSIGQGALITTPVQLAYSIGGIALGGIFKQPHLLKDMKDVAEERVPLSETTTEKLSQAMWSVVNGEGGTAAASRLQGVEFCGKTGTAQLISFEGLKRAGSHKKFTDNAWFVGYAPRRNPEIVIAVLVEHGAHGSSAAAPVARDIVKRYYEKKEQQQKGQTTAQAAPPAPTGVAAAVR